MFKHSFRSNNNGGSQPAAAAGTTDSQHRVDKAARLMRKGTNFNPAAGSVRDPAKLSKLQRSLSGRNEVLRPADKPQPLAPSPIVTLTVGSEGRLFAAHEDVLRQSPFFERALRGSYLEQSYAQSRRIALPDEEPEIFSAVLEYLYKGDYYPRLLHNKHRNSWELEDSLPHRGTPNTSPNIPENYYGGGRAGHPSSPATAASSSPRAGHPSAVEATVYLSSAGQHLLRDTVIYCAAERYGLEELKRLALRKQGLQSGIDVGTILRSAQYCYAHTPDSDSRLRAHYLALIIRCRKTFKRSGTMQAEMERGGEGGKLFFDLFVALCNHLDDVIEAGNKGTPKTI
ncbi:Btb poz-like protein [Pleurostoma richardsiae]|uniref:Btb poz-like protein n=1 Tax=Pleurostoma richardsiae TaxID=41990 RepID=A0AA38R2M2_9PEZI|nr:Btb poz-like protein [Pleurostoma richardsiae]